MSELTRLLPPPERPVAALDPFAGPFGNDDADAGAGSGGQVTVSSGLYHHTLPASGATVGEMRRRFASELDIDPSATAVIDGQTVADENSTRLRAGQVLAFVRLAGEKGH